MITLAWKLLVSERHEVSVEFRLRVWDPRGRSLDVRSQDSSFQKEESRMNTDIESKSGLSIPSRIQKANLPSRFRIREKCVEPNRGRDEVDVSFNFDRNTVLITNKLRSRCFGVLIDLAWYCQHRETSSLEQQYAHFIFSLQQCFGFSNSRIEPDPTGTLQD